MANADPITPNLTDDNIRRFPIAALLLRISDRLEAVTDGLDALRVMAVSQVFNEEQEGALLCVSNLLDDRHAVIVQMVEQAREAVSAAAAQAPAEAPADAAAAV